MEIRDKLLLAIAQAQQAQVRLQALQLDLQANALNAMYPVAGVGKPAQERRAPWASEAWWLALEQARASGLEIDLEPLVDVQRAREAAVSR